MCKAIQTRLCVQWPCLRNGADVTSLISDATSSALHNISWALQHGPCDPLHGVRLTSALKAHDVAAPKRVERQRCRRRSQSLHVRGGPRSTAAATVARKPSAGDGGDGAGGDMILDQIQKKARVLITLSLCGCASWKA